MHAVDIAYASRRDLCDHVVSDDDRLALVIPAGRGSVPEGESVSVRIKADGLPGDAMFDGRAREVRIGSRTMLAVVPENGDRNRLAFLRDWAKGSAPTAYRREDRLDIPHVPAVITLATPAVRRETVKLLDVSDRGARISFPEPLARGSLLILEMNTPDGIVGFAASVMWASHAMVGLQLCHSFSSERALWAQLVASMRGLFGERVAASLVPDEVVMDVFEVAAGDAVTFASADDTDDSPASTGAYRIVDRRAVQSRHARAVETDGATANESVADTVQAEPLAEDLADFVIGRIAVK